MTKQLLIAAALASLAAAGCPALAATPEASAMPAAQQNAMVAKYCAVCHMDATPNGGLSLQHFDAARPDPGLMAMMAAKLHTGALGASGAKLPDKPTQDAFLRALPPNPRARTRGS